MKATRPAKHLLYRVIALASMLFLMLSCGGQEQSGDTTTPGTPDEFTNISLDGTWAWVNARDGKIHYHVTIEGSTISSFEQVSPAARRIQYQHCQCITDPDDFPVLQFTEAPNPQGYWRHQIRFDLTGLLPSAQLLAGECIPGHLVTREISARSDDFPTPDLMTSGKLCRRAE